MSSRLSLLKSIFITLKICFPGSEYITSHNHKSNSVSCSTSPFKSYILADSLLSTLFNNGSHMFINNSDENGTVASHTDIHHQKFVIFLKSEVNHIQSID
jgi:hypothetical protein